MNNINPAFAWLMGPSGVLEAQQGSPNNPWVKASIGSGIKQPTPQTSQTSPPTAPPTVNPQMATALQDYLAKLTGQASGALNGGLLGYSPSMMTAPNGQSFAAPQGNFRDPYTSMQGILGGAQPPTQQPNPYGNAAYPMRMY